MSDSESQKVVQTSGKKNPFVFIGIVVLVIIVLGWIITMAGTFFFASKLNQALRDKGVQYKADDNSFRYKDESGASINAGTGTTLPNDFPKDFPIYQNSKIISAISLKNTTDITFNIEGKNVKAIVKWYEEKLPQSGWKADSNSPGAQLARYEKNNLSALLVFIQNKGNTVLKTTITKK